MCRYANVFMPKLSEQELLLSEPPEGLHVSIDDNVEEQILRLFGNLDGVHLLFHDGHCLCQYEEWESLFQYVDTLRRENNLTTVQLVVFWSGTTYEVQEPIDFDPELDTLMERPEEGRVFELGVSIPRRLKLHIGKATRMKLKSGRHLEGILETYDSQGQYGSLQTKSDGEVVYFNAAEIQHIDI